MTHENQARGSLCRICGFENGPQPQSAIIKCECCGVRIGLEDQRAADIALWRAKWISNGGKWRKRPGDASATDAAE